MNIPKQKTLFVEAVAADKMRADVWLKALGKSKGNIANAAVEFGFTRQRGHALTKKLGLVDEALRMRLAVGQPATGRPRIIKE